MRFMAAIAPAILGICLAACSGASDDATQYSRDLAAATDQARAKLPWYWEHFDAPEVDEYDFTLKVAFPRTDAPRTGGQAETEDAWVENLARGEPGHFVGELMVDPKYMGALREGAIMKFEDRQIVDWAFLRGEELIGHYTTRVMLPTLPPDQADMLRSMLGENPR